MTSPPTRRDAMALLVVGCLGLGACSGLRIHDEGRARLATDARQAYDTIKVGEITAGEQGNLAFLLGEEIKAVRSNVQLQADFTMLSIAADERPLAATAHEAARRLKQLGADGAAQDSIRNGPPALEAAQRRLRTKAQVYKAFGLEPPDCRSLPATLNLPDGLSEQRRKILNDDYPAYGDACHQADPRTHFSRGEIGEAYVRWNDARLALDERRAEATAAARELRKVSADYQAKADELAALKLSGEALQARLKEQAATLADALKKAQALDAGVEADELLGALTELLTAAAGGATDPASASLRRAVAVARALPALAGDLAQFEAGRRLPPVSGLLLAMRHQALLAQAAHKRMALAQERVDILKARADAIVAEADAWLGLADALCSHAVIASGAKPPGPNCKDFAVTQDGASWSCSMAGAPVAGCLLAQSWKARLRAGASGEVRRELAKAEMRYLQAQFAAAMPTEQRLREIDVRHRESVLAKQIALDAWNNLIGTPLVQLDTFHQTGVKPQDLADLIVKALGFTALAIGVAQ